MIFLQQHKLHRMQVESWNSEIGGFDRWTKHQNREPGEWRFVHESNVVVAQEIWAEQKKKGKQKVGEE